MKAIVNLLSYEKSETKAERARFKTWTQTLDLDPGTGPRKTRTLKQLDAKKRVDDQIV